MEVDRINRFIILLNYGNFVDMRYLKHLIISIDFNDFLYL